eukprot:1214796-Pyramimonas_sp.AAC.1
MPLPTASPLCIWSGALPRSRRAPPPGPLRPLLQRPRPPQLRHATSDLPFPPPSAPMSIGVGPRASATTVVARL